MFVSTGKGALFPNLYCFLIAHPGVGKTSTIRRARQYYQTIPEPYCAPTSLNHATIIDALVKCRRIVRQRDIDLDYNSMYITADELTAFIHKYDDQIIGVMSAFYDPDSYGHWRRGNEIRIQINSPQLNVLCGSTPSNLLKLMPESAWEQGFTSRIIMVFSDERILGDDFAITDSSLDDNLTHDLRVISSVIGEFKVTAAYRDAVTAWRTAGEPPAPTHPKLLHYTTRRRVHIYKLSMVSAIDRSDVLLLTKEDFDRALAWLVEAEGTMSEIFKTGAGTTDARAMDEIYHFVLTSCAGGRKVPSYKIVHFAKDRIPLHSVDKVISTMEKSGLLKQAGLDPNNKNVILYTPGVPDHIPHSDII